MTVAVAQALWSHWRRNPLQLFTLVAGLALATALWSGVQAINAEARASYDAAAATLGEGRYDQIVSRDGGAIGQARYIELRRAGWRVSPVVEGRLPVSDGTVRLVGLEPLTAPEGLGPVTLGGGVALNDFLTGDIVFADADTAARLREIPTLRVQIDPAVAPGTALSDIGLAQRLLGMQEVLSRMIVVAPAAAPGAALDVLAPELGLQTAQGTADMGRLTDSFHLNLTAFGLLSFAVGIFIVHGAIGLAFEQRRGMVRTMRALGLPLRRLIALLAAEMAVLSLAGGLVGVALGYVLAGLLLPDVAATLRGLYGAEVTGTLRLRADWWFSGLGIALAGSALAAFGALWRIARMPVLASAQRRAWAMASRQNAWLRGAAAALLLVAGAGIAVVGQGLVAGFALLGCLLIGAALTLPLFLDLALRCGQSLARGALWQWFWADTRQQIPGLGLALMALMLAMAANVGVSTMVSSFRATFIGFLDQRLAAELYVTADTPDRGVQLQTFVEGRGGSVLPLLSVDATLAGLPAELYGARIGPTYRDNWTFLAASPAVWDRIARGEAVIVNEQLARRAGIWVGDPLQVAAGRDLPVAGVFGDYGNPIGQAIIGEALFAALHPDVRATQFGVRTQTPDTLRSALVDEIGIAPGSIIDQASIKAFSLQVFERTFTVTGALNVLTLAVAGFAIFMSLLTLAGLRVPQLAPAWALGMTRRSLGRLELLRAVTLAGLTALAALPVGLALAWVLLAVVNVEAFGWRLPMFLYPVDYAILGLAALLATAVAALWPARRLATIPPAELLKVFANER